MLRAIIRVADEISKINKSIGLDKTKIIQNLDEKEIQNQKEHGHGYENFRISLLEASQNMLGYDFFKFQVYEFIDYQIRWLRQRPVELIDDVSDTIVKLKEQNFELWILTKGKNDEQNDKLKNLNIKKYFKKMIIMENKNPESYQKVIDENNLSIENCYMIGNSPKSDINNAKAIGLKTIFIPNARTWVPEKERISENGPTTIRLERFSELLTVDFSKGCIN